MPTYSFIKTGLIAGLVMVTTAPVAGIFIPGNAFAQADIRQEDRRADRQQDRQADRQQDRRLDRQADRQTDRQVDRQQDRQADRRQDRPARSR